MKIVATTGVWNRSETSVSRAGASRSNDHAKTFRVPSMKPVGVHQRMASTNAAATAISRKCGPGRKFAIAGRYGEKEPVHLSDPSPRPMKTAEPKNLKPKY